MPEPEIYELNEFIQYSLSKGIPKESIEELLISSGWPKKFIESVLSKRLPAGEISKASAKSSIISMKGICKSFGKHVVLNNINLSIKPGELFGVIGLSGSGKTTLLNTFVGFVPPDSGDVTVTDPEDGKEHSIFKRRDLVHKTFGFATQKPSFYDQLTVQENIEYFASLYSVPEKDAAARAKSLLKLVGLEDSKDVLAANLSGGMQKRVDIICSLIHNPKILIMDEPTSDLDPIARTEMWDLIKEINKRGTTVILASHFLTEMEDLCTRVGILHNRKIVEVGTPEELKSIYSKDYEIIIETKDKEYDKLESSLKGKKSIGIQSVSQKGKALVVYTQKPEETLAFVSAMVHKHRLRLADITLNRPTLMEIFEYLVKKNGRQ